MGAPKLKKKAELNYRRGPSTGGCSICDHARRDFPVEQIASPRGLELRCEIMGFKAGRAYRIHPDNICDRFDNSRYMARFNRDVA